MASQRRHPVQKVIQKEIESLRAEIERHNYKYYVEAAPEISDLAFDRLMRRLRELEAGHPERVTPDSPSQRVGGKPLAGFQHVRHGSPMLSIENTYSEAELREFDGRTRRLLKQPPHYVVEHKIDGVSVALRYKKGRLVLGATRGDGLTGDDITANVRTIRDIPLRLLATSRAPPGALEVRGEVYMTHEELARLNQLQTERRQRAFANVRNAAAGSLKLLDSRLCAQRRLRFFAHTEGEVEGAPLSNHLEFLELARGLGIPVVPHSLPLDSIDDVLGYAEQYFELRHTLDYETDGIVVKVNDFAQRRRLGESSRAPRWAIAYKVELWQATTRLKNIYVQVGKTGVLTPVGELEQVMIAGTKVARVSLFNAAEIERKHLRIGDMLVVEKAGKVIPHVVRVELERRSVGARRYRFPQKCPACGSKVVRDVGGVAIRCLNPSCPAQLKERLRCFVRRNAMDIDGFGPALIAQLVDRGLVRSLPDLYRLKPDRLAELERMRQKSIRKLLDAIEASKGRELARVLTGLAIRHIGERNAQLLAETFGSVANLLRASDNQLARRSGIGAVAARSAYRFLHSPEGRRTIAELRACGVKMPSTKAAGQGRAKLGGQKFVVTGTLDHYSRQEIQELIRRLGGRVTSSVSHETNYVITGADPGSKADKARRLGVPLLTESAFLQMIGRPASRAST